MHSATAFLLHSLHAPAVQSLLLSCVASLYSMSPGARTGEVWIVGLGCVVVPCLWLDSSVGWHWHRVFN